MNRISNCILELNDDDVEDKFKTEMERDEVNTNSCVIDTKESFLYIGCRSRKINCLIFVSTDINLIMNIGYWLICCRVTTDRFHRSVIIIFVIKVEMLIESNNILFFSSSLLRVFKWL